MTSPTPKQKSKRSRRTSRPLPLPRPSLLKKYFRDSETLVVARATSAGAFITGIIGALDWSPLLGMSGLDRKQIISMAAIVLLIGVSTEVARRMRSDA